MRSLSLSTFVFALCFDLSMLFCFLFNFQFQHGNVEASKVQAEIDEEERVDTGTCSLVEYCKYCKFD